MNKIRCSTLKEPDLWMNFEKKKKSPYLPTHRWNGGSGVGNEHIFKGGLRIVVTDLLHIPNLILKLCFYVIL